jgi:hypothetical protein
MINGALLTVILSLAYFSGYSWAGKCDGRFAGVTCSAVVDNGFDQPSTDTTFETDCCQCLQDITDAGFGDLITGAGSVQIVKMDKGSLNAHKCAVNEASGCFIDCETSGSCLPKAKGPCMPCKGGELRWDNVNGKDSPCEHHCSYLQHELKHAFDAERGLLDKNPSPLDWLKGSSDPQCIGPNALHGRKMEVDAVGSGNGFLKERGRQNNCVCEPQAGHGNCLFKPTSVNGARALSPAAVNLCLPPKVFWFLGQTGNLSEGDGTIRADSVTAPVPLQYASTINFGPVQIQHDVSDPNGCGSYMATGGFGAVAGGSHGTASGGASGERTWCNTNGTEPTSSVNATLCPLLSNGNPGEYFAIHVAGSALLHGSGSGCLYNGGVAGLGQGGPFGAGFPASFDKNFGVSFYDVVESGYGNSACDPTNYPGLLCTRYDCAEIDPTGGVSNCLGGAYSADVNISIDVASCTDDPAACAPCGLDPGNATCAGTCPNGQTCNTVVPGAVCSCQ